MKYVEIKLFRHLLIIVFESKAISKSIPLNICLWASISSICKLSSYFKMYHFELSIHNQTQRHAVQLVIKVCIWKQWYFHQNFVRNTTDFSAEHFYINPQNMVNHTFFSRKRVIKNVDWRRRCCCYMRLKPPNFKLGFGMFP